MTHHIRKDFDELVKTELPSDDDIRITMSCPVGLWSVTGASMRDVQREAMHYFMRYRDDGEYDALLKDDSI